MEFTCYIYYIFALLQRANKTAENRGIFGKSEYISKKDGYIRYFFYGFQVIFVFIFRYVFIGIAGLTGITIKEKREKKKEKIKKKERKEKDKGHGSSANEYFVDVMVNSLVRPPYRETTTSKASNDFHLISYTYHFVAVSSI